MVVAAVCGALAPPAAARAQGDPGGPIVDNDYAIDIAGGPILGSGRALGMGGAFVAVAEGLESTLWNPAGYGARPIYSLDWFEFEPVLGIFGPGSFSKDDFFNNGGRVPAESAVFVSVGTRFQLGNTGFGALALIQDFEVPTASAGLASVSSIAPRYGIAHGFGDGQLVLGIGARTAIVSVDLGGEPLINFRGTSVEVGGVLRPERFPWRVGMVVRAPVMGHPTTGDTQTDADGVERVAGFVIPDRIVQPWELRVGGAWQFGPRPMNRRWRREGDPEPELRGSLEAQRCFRRREQAIRELAAAGHPHPAQEVGQCPWLTRQPADPAWLEAEEARVAREEIAFERDLEDARQATSTARKAAVAALPRRYVLLSAELTITGRTADAVGFDGFIDQVVRRSGDRVTVSPRIGAEAEPVADWLKVRAGFYLEPARAARATPRPHGTLGFEVKLFSWDLFGLIDPFTFTIGGTGDFAPRYVNVGIGIGFWH